MSATTEPLAILCQTQPSQEAQMRQHQCFAPCVRDEHAAARMFEHVYNEYPGLDHCISTSAGNRGKAYGGMCVVYLFGRSYCLQSWIFVLQFIPCVRGGLHSMLRTTGYELYGLVPRFVALIL